MIESECQGGNPTFRRPIRPSGPHDWEARRQKISWYYIQEDYTLDQLQSAMLRKHGFYATRRQYCVRLKQWNLRKNLAASEKEQIIDKIVAARLLGHSITDVTYGGRQIDLDLLLNHVQSQPPSSDLSSIAEQVQKLHEMPPKRSSTRSVPANVSTDWIQIIYQDSDSSVTGPLKPDSSPNDWAMVLNSLTANSTHVQFKATGKDPDAKRMFPALPYAPTRGLERIISLSQNYIFGTLESRTKNTPAQAHAAHPLPRFPNSESAALRNFWVDVKNAMYMAKKHEGVLTFKFASRACAAIQAPSNMEIELGTLKDVLATFSPTNANACPPLRDHLLHYMSEMLGIRFGVQHPLVLLCGELRKETSNQEIYKTALQFAIELMGTVHGTQPSDALAFRRELVRLLRRSGNLCRAEELCIEQESYCVREFGIDALLTRRATSDRVHVLMAKKESVQAMAICEDLVERSRLHLGRDFPDELAVYALEDLAELCELHDFPRRSLLLLQEAHPGAVRLWGAEASATEYILSKIQAASKV